MRGFLSILVLAAMPQLLLAAEPYDPYAPSMDAMLPPVAADGKLNWPAFFKSAATERRFQSYFATGSCTGTNKNIVNMLQDNKVVVNSLPEASLQGLAVKTVGGVLLMVDSHGEPCALVSHPAKVTKVRVEGTISPAAIRPGMVVQFLARVDGSGRGKDPIDEISVVNGNPSIKPVEVQGNKLQIIVGTVTRVTKNIVQLQVASGHIRRLTFPLAEKLVVNVDANSLDVVLPGSEVTVTGHIYEGPGSMAKKTVFASEIAVAETFPPKPKAAANPAAEQVAAGQQ